MPFSSSSGALCSVARDPLISCPSDKSLNTGDAPCCVCVYVRFTDLFAIQMTTQRHSAFKISLILFEVFHSFKKEISWTLCSLSRSVSPSNTRIWTLEVFRF